MRHRPDGRAKRRQRRLAVLAGASVLCAFASADAADIGAKPRLVSLDHKVGAETSALVRIVNGTPTDWFPAVGALLHGQGDSFDMHCSGTLIGCDAFLTAAHCVKPDLNAAHYKVYFQHGGLFDVRSVDYPRRDYRPADDKTGSRADVAVVRLKQAADGIAPLHLNEDREQASGSASQIVGFGQTAQSIPNDGLKRFGNVKTAACPSGFPRSEMVCWHYSRSQGSDTCYTDSGGPLVMSDNRTYEVVSGVTSSGTDPTCVTNDNAYDASVFRNQKWIKSASDLGTTPAQCGALALFAKDDGTRYRGAMGQINDGVPQHEFEVAVQNVTRLRIGASFARPSGLGDRPFVDKPGLYLVAGQSRDLSRSLCPPMPTAQAVFCELKSPADGVYTVVLRRDGPVGTADFQLVVSVY